MDFNPDKIRLIIGLGNPGKKYADTYHSVGCLTADYLKSQNILDSRFYILNSNSYMNESGAFIIKTIKKFGVKPDELLIIQDDSDIAIGKYKLSFGRGSAGHKGIESIIKTIKTKNFWRLRIGIRPKKLEVRSQKSEVRLKANLPAIAQRAKAGEFVLKKISKTNQKILNEIFKEIEEILTDTKNPKIYSDKFGD
ncbi:MAG: peptidyl-tRNA hydrolase [Candidatus Brennerbacteria bacterium]|nr:peptidyl-tRNA hydrolase [Candidatus Brennerbacteria bacterium]